MLPGRGAISLRIIQDFDDLLRDLIDPLQSGEQPLSLSDATQPDLPLVSVNDAFCDLTGYAARDAIGRNCRFLQGPKTDQAAVARLRRAIAAGKLGTAVLTNYRQDGTPFVNEVIVTPIRDPTGRLRYFAGMQREITADAAVRPAHEDIRFVSRPDGSIEFLPSRQGRHPTFAECLSPGDLRRLRYAAAGSAAGVRPLRLKFALARDGEDQRMVQLTARHHAFEDGVLFEGQISDAPHDSQLEARLHLLEAVASNANDAIVITEAEPLDLPGPRIIYVNEGIRRHTGYNPAQLIGRTPRILQGPATDFRDAARLGAALRRWERATVQLLNYRADGSTFWNEISIAPVADETGWWTHWISVQRDVTERRAASDRIAYLAQHDPLTGLANRRLATARMAGSLDGARSGGDSCAAIRIDLDRFKLINDTFGHAAGDAVLAETGRRLRGAVRPGDTVARVGGDEFLAILPGLTGREALAAAAERIRSATTGVVLWENRQIAVAASVGAALFPDDAGDAEGLLAAADISLYRAKQSGRGRAHIFSADLRQETETRRELGEALRQGLDRHEFEPFFQPQVSLTDRRLIGLEALARWRHPTRGIVPPGDFLPIAIEAGVMETIDERMAEMVLRAASGWQSQGLDFGRVSINLSAEAFGRQALVQDLQNLLARYRLPPQCLVVEMVESVFIGNHAPEVANRLRQLRRAGIAVDLDDFGTGYASLTHLRTFSVDRIKLDRSFVSEIGVDPDDEIIVGAVVRLTKSLGLTCIAEGVETEEQVSFLRALGCDEGQGYLFAKPMDEADMTRWLKDGNGAPARTLPRAMRTPKLKTSQTTPSPPRRPETALRLPAAEPLHPKPK